MVNVTFYIQCIFTYTMGRCIIPVVGGGTVLELDFMALPFVSLVCVESATFLI